MPLPGRKQWPRTGSAVISNQHGAIWIYRLGPKKWEVRVFDLKCNLWVMATHTTFKAAQAQAETFRNTAREKCPHGYLIGACASCDVRGDLAYDAAREDRYR